MKHQGDKGCNVCEDKFEAERLIINEEHIELGWYNTFLILEHECLFVLLLSKFASRFRSVTVSFLDLDKFCNEQIKIEVSNVKKNIGIYTAEIKTLISWYKCYCNAIQYTDHTCCSADLKRVMNSKVICNYSFKVS